MRVCESTIRGLSGSSIAQMSELLLRLCVALRPAQHAEHSPQVVVLDEEGSSGCSCPSRRRGARVQNARYAASQAVASLGEASARLLRLCVALRPAQRAEHPPQVVVLGEEGSSCCSCP